MSILQILYAAVIFVSVTAAAMIILLSLAPSRAKRRLEAVAESSGFAEAAARAQWTKTIVEVAGKFAKLSLPSEGWENSPLRLRFLHAGHRGDAPAILFFGAKTALALLLPFVAYAYLMFAGAKPGTNGMLVTLVACAALGYYLPNLVLGRQVFVRQREIFETFPDAADLLMVCVEAGLGLDAALVKVAEEMRLKSEALAAELHLVNLELRAGSSRDKALRNFALRTGVEEVSTFATMLIQADRFGTSIGQALRIHADTLRQNRQHAAEEMAAKASVKMSFPLVLFIFPATFIVLAGPTVIGLLNSPLFK